MKKHLKKYALNLGSYRYKYVAKTINRVIKPNKIGNYALGKIIIENQRHIFRVYYIGRSDTDLKTEIAKYLNEKTEYHFFKFVYHTTEQQAYEHECKNFHLLKKRKEKKYYNKIHPAKPQNSKICCPICKCTN
ncbi:MAG: hypothetical protein EPN82_13280 [Bacteroidetes bacterium]|nr:MAG: hypothetical protein EPN82_13280 [Bacteroidota bacterium]